VLHSRQRRTARTVQSKLEKTCAHRSKNRAWRGRAGARSSVENNSKHSAQGLGSAPQQLISAREG
jgi:hypothetical protein